MKSAAHMSATKRALLDRYLHGAASNDTAAIRPRPQGALAPLSFCQEEVYKREQRVNGNPPLYNECIAVRMSGAFDPVALQRAFDEIVRRHEIWRTTFETKASIPQQVVHRFQPIAFDICDLRDIPSEQRESEVLRIISEKSRRPFQLASELPLRPTLVRIEDREYRLYLVAHQIVLDGMSAYQIYPSELAALYQCFSQGKPSPLPDLPLQYGDFAHWQRESLIAEFPRQIEHWRKRLGSELLASGKSDSTMPTFHGRIESFAFSEQLSVRIRQLSRMLNATDFLVLLSALAILLQRRTGERLVRIGTLSSSGRIRTEVMGLLGYFLNPVTLLFDFSADPSFSDLVAQARIALTEAISNDDVPMERVADDLCGRAAHAPDPFFTVCTSMQPPQPNLGLPWQVTSMDVDSGGSPWDLYLAFIETARPIVGRAQFNPEIFEPITVHKYLRELEMVLDRACAHAAPAAAGFVRS